MARSRHKGMGLAAGAAVLAFAAGRYSDIGAPPPASTTSAEFTTPAELPGASAPPPAIASEPPSTRRSPQRFASRAEGAAPVAPAARHWTGDGGVYYRNCSHARAMGAAPVMAGDPGYRAGLDRDGDGVGCE